MALTELIMVMTAARTGGTGVLEKRWPYKDGLFRIVADESIIHKKIRFFGRYHKAFPEGSKELAAAQEIDRGNSALQAQLQRRGSATPEPPVQPVVQRPADIPAPNRGPADTGGQPAPQHGSTGDGHPDAGVDGAAKFPEAIRAAVTQLDSTNDDHWTVDGLPRVDVVAAIMNKPDLGRRDLNEFASGMVRPTE